jgi:glutamate dehydrogenase/leucine dehydrogenase
VLVLPDFIANSGGVICAAVEYRGGTENEALVLIDEKIRANTAACSTRCGTPEQCRAQRRFRSRPST